MLQNGIILAAEKIPSAKSVSIGFYFFVGSRFEAEGEYGISHFTEHLLFKGTKNHSAKEIAKIFDKMGGYINAFTEREQVCLYSLVPAKTDFVFLALKTMLEMSEDSIFPIDEVEKERNVVLSEIAGVQDDLEESALEEAASLLWKDSSLGKPIAGTSSDVKNLTLEKILLWYKKYFAEGKLLVSIAGNFGVEEAISILENGKTHRAQREEENLTESFFASSGKLNVNGIFFKEAPFNQNQIFLIQGFHTPIDSKTYFALAILNVLTGESFSSRLFDSLREKLALCYSVYSVFSAYEKNAVWYVASLCEKEKTLEVIKALHCELDLLFENGVLDSEIADAKEHLCGEEFINSEDTEAVMRRNQKFISLNIPISSSEELIEKINEVTSADIEKVVKEIFLPNNRLTFVYGQKLTEKEKKICKTLVK